MTVTLDFNDFLVHAHNEDMTPAVRAALESLPAEGGTLRFAPGVYHFWPDRALERHYFMSNNDHGLKRIAFPLIERRDVTLDGQGAELIFHGRVLPFVVDRSSNITIKNFTVDYERTFYTQGEIVAASASHVDLKIDGQAFPWRIENGRMIFSGKDEDGADFTWVMLLVQYDPKTRAMATNRPYHIGRFLSIAHIDRAFDAGAIRITATDLGEGIIRLEAPFGEGFIVGHTLVLSHEYRYNPGVLITESESVRLEGITLHHVGAMGVLGQLSRDITLSRVEARLREGTDRMVSVLADATHFVNCEGTVKLEDCVFENMLDDGGNFHGICTTVSRVLGPDMVELELMHFEQHGIQLYRPGDQVEFINRRTMQPFHSAVVRAARAINRRFIEVTFEEDLGGRVTVGDAADNVTRLPEVEIRRCRTGHNRPRGFLLTSNRRTVVEDNTFYNSGAGIWISGDANYWYESGPVRDVVIRRNRFLECGYADGCPPIIVAPELPEATAETPCYHRNILIEDNEFRTVNGRILQAQSVDGLRLRGNSHTLAGPAAPEGAVTLTGCRNVELQEGLD